MADTHDPRTHLLDLPDALLIMLLSPAHCSGCTSHSAATKCQALRQVALLTAPGGHADIDDLALALAFPVRSLPQLRRLRLHSDYRASLADTELHALAAVTRLHDLEVHLPELHTAHQRAARAAQDWSALAALTGLRRPTLTRCGINNAFLDTIAVLPHIHNLALEHNLIREVHALAAATALTSLNLRGNAESSGTSLTALTHLTVLSHLDLRDCRRTYETAALAALTSLTHLNVSRASMNLHEIAPLTRLRCLEMGSCSTRHDALLCLTALTRLDLTHTDVEESDMRAVATMAGLASLTRNGRMLHWPWHCSATSLSALTALTSLSLEHCRLCEPVCCGLLAAMPRLQELKLTGCEVGDGGAAGLETLTALVRPDLWPATCLPPGLALALAALTGLTSLRLRYPLNDDGARAVARLSRLRYLELRHCCLSALSVATLGALTTLTSLTVIDRNLAEGRGIGNAGARTLEHLSELQSLTLHRQRVCSQGAAVISALTGLTQLDLLHNAVGHEGALALGALSNLQSMCMSGNHLGPDGGAALAPLSRLTSLHLSNTGLLDAGCWSMRTDEFDPAALPQRVLIPGGLRKACRARCCHTSA